MAKICRQSGKQFEISALESTLHERLGVPSPTLSPRERMRRFTAFNNYLNLFQITCAGTGKKIVSMYRPDVPFPVYSTPYWWSEAWDGATYGVDYQLSENFFDQLLALRNVVPMPALSINYLTLENCDYVNGASFSKNCYLSFLCTHSEDCLFCFNVRTCKDCTDCTIILNCELCYDCTFAVGCYELRHSVNCRSCSDSYFLADCISCRNCFGCVGMTQAQYCYFNEQLSKTDYESRISKIHFDSRTEIENWKAAFSKHKSSFPSKTERLMSCENSSGDFLDNCKNAENSFCSSNLEDCANCLAVDSAKDCVDLYTWGAAAELIYCCSRIGTSVSNIKFSYVALTNSSNLEYCIMCIGCSDCFGCVGLRNKKYHILNKPYSEGDYRELKAQIIKAMSSPSNPVDERYGEFLPIRLSMFPYNDSDAMLFFPSNKSEVKQLGARWAEDLDTSKYQISDWSIIPDRTSDLPEDLCSKAFECPTSGKAFKITARELAIYKKSKIPIPSKHWLIRIEERNFLVAPRYE